MNNIIGELFPKIMGGYFKLELPPQRQQPYSDELFSQSSHAIQTGTVIYDFAADRNAYQGGCCFMRWRQSHLCVFAPWIAMFSGLPNIQTLYLD
jgi:hypothetical protein